MKKDGMWDQSIEEEVKIYLRLERYNKKKKTEQKYIFEEEPLLGDKLLRIDQAVKKMFK